MKTLVLPEGGELPPEEELQALEAAEQAEAEAAAEAHEEALRATEEALVEDDPAAEPQPEGEPYDAVADCRVGPLGGPSAVHWPFHTAHSRDPPAVDDATNRPLLAALQPGPSVRSRWRTPPVLGI